MSRADFDGVEEVVSAFFDAGDTPGLAYGVVESGQLAHGGGRGRTGVDGRVPDADSVFRIASMTKSFTAAAVLSLRDAGQLLLDTPADEYVPELIGLAMPSTDSPRLTVRHLLTMSGGLPTDDAWADRQESLSDEQFSEFLEGGFSFDSTPGTQFEYSNLGFAILGRIVANVSGETYRDYVASRLLQPLGLEHTVYDSGSVPADLLVRGHRRVDDDWQREDFDSPGAFSSIGGLYSSVEDLAEWVGGLAGGFPTGDGTSDRHPLSRATRREMQQQHRSMPPSARLSPTGLLHTSVAGYGFGLFVDSDLRWGTVVSHPGGYPGFGSCMCWHPASGLGVVVLANATYAKVTSVCREALEQLLETRAQPSRRIRPWPQAAQLRADVASLIAGWDDALADQVFAVNMDLDVPRGRRRTDVAGAVERVGGVTEPAAVLDLEAQSPSQLTWWVPGRSGRLRVHLGLSPERPPKIQSLTVDAVPQPTDVLLGIARSVTDAFNADPLVWPVDLPLQSGVDVGPSLRLSAAVCALDGPLVLIPEPAKAEGSRSATFELSSNSASWRLTITLEKSGDRIAGCELTAVDLTEQRNAAVFDE